MQNADRLHQITINSLQSLVPLVLANHASGTAVQEGFLEQHTPDIFFILEQFLDGLSAPTLFSSWGGNALLIQPI